MMIDELPPTLTRVDPATQKGGMMSEDSTMPERIYAGTWPGYWYSTAHLLTTEYIRADVAQARIAAAEDMATQAVQAAVTKQAQLDAANKRIAELEAAQRWILVGERLPNDEDEGVIVWTNNGSDYKFFNYDIGFHHEKFGWLLSTEWEHGDPTVTHWMPLPPPPVTPRVASVGANYAPTYRPRLRVALKERIEASGVSVETLIERELQAMGVEE